MHASPRKNEDTESKVNRSRRYGNRKTQSLIFLNVFSKQKLTKGSSSQQAPGASQPSSLLASGCAAIVALCAIECTNHQAVFSDFLPLSSFARAAQSPVYRKSKAFQMRASSIDSKGSSSTGTRVAPAMTSSDMSVMPLSSTGKLDNLLVFMRGVTSFFSFLPPPPFQAAISTMQRSLCRIAHPRNLPGKEEVNLIGRVGVAIESSREASFGREIVQSLVPV